MGTSYYSEHVSIPGFSLRFKVFTPSATYFTPLNGLYMHVKHHEKGKNFRNVGFLPIQKS